MDDLDNFLNLNEAKSTSTRRIGREEKINRQIAALAIQKAKEEEDSLYDQFKKYRDLYKKFKDKIIQKYRSKVRQQAMK